MDLPQLIDQDVKFLGVVDRIDKSNIDPGYVAKAVNRLFDRSVIRNRWGVVRPPWGGIWTTTSRAVTASSTSASISAGQGSVIPNDIQIYSDPDILYLSSVTVSERGSGYTNGGPYNAVITGGGGTGATATFIVSGGGIDSVTVTSGGVGYSSAPSISFSAAGSGSGQAVTKTMRSVKVYPNGTRAYSSTSNSALLSKKSLGWDAAANLSFFNGLNAFSDIVGFLTYREPVSGLDVILVAVNHARGDGGNGQVYALRPGQSHRSLFAGSTTDQIPMNGHDFYQTVRMVQCGDGVLLLRSGLTRYYFTGASNVIDTSNNQIRLQVDPDQINTGDKLMFMGLGSQPNIGNLATGKVYFARRTGTDIAIELYDTKENATTTANTTGRISLTATSASQRYYVQVVDPPNFWTHQQTQNIVSTTPNVDAPPLIMQATETLANPISVGFDRLPEVSVTSVNTTTGLFTAPSHRLVPGDSITFKDSTIGGISDFDPNHKDATTWYIYPVDPNSFYLYSLIDDALANSDATNAREIPTPGGSGTARIIKTGVSGGPMPNCREAIYVGNRVFALYGPDFIAISDILDPLTYLPIQNEFRLNAGTNDKAIAIYPFNESTIVIFKQRSILALTGVTADLSSIRLVEITRDYGCVSATSIASTGTDIIWLSQRGVVSLKQTEYGLTQSVVIPLSYSIQDTINTIDWSSVDKACGVYWDNKYLLSVPVNDGNGTNTKTIVYNFINQAWDGEWTGSTLIPRFFERAYVNGSNRLIFADESGFVHFFDPLSLCDRDYSGDEIDIETQVDTRGYDCGTKDHKQWVEGRMAISAWNPVYSIDSIYDDQNYFTEQRASAGVDRTKYTRYGLADYDETNVNDDFNAPHRADYSFSPGIRVGSGFQAGLKTSSVQKVRPRGHSSSIQYRIATTQGSTDINAVYAAGIPFRLFGKSDT